MSKTKIPETIPDVDFGNQGGDEDAVTAISTNAAAVKPYEAPMAAKLAADVRDADEEVVHGEVGPVDFGAQGDEGAELVEPELEQTGPRTFAAPDGTGDVDFGAQGDENATAEAPAKKAAAKAPARKAPAKKAPAKKAAAKKAR